MSKPHDEIDASLAEWLGKQKLFFVATAPLAAEGLINCSPKGMDSFRVLDPRTVAYLDLTGSGVETIAHLRENGRICLTFCAFEGSPRIVRLQGTGSVLVAGSPEYDKLSDSFPQHAGARSIVQVDVARIGDTCGFAVPKFSYVGDRDALIRWAESKGEDGLAEYRNQKNALSLDGLPGLDPSA